MATKDQKALLNECMAELMTALGKKPEDYYVDVGQGGCLIVGPGGVPPFGFVRYTPAMFLDAMEFAKTVVEAMKK